MGQKLWLEEWEYPPIGVYLATDPSGGHALFALDYRECGKDGEPKVVLVEQESDFEIVELAPISKPLSAACGMKMSFQMSKHKIEKSKSSETRSVGFAHEPNPKFQTTSFSRHCRRQGPRYNVHRRGK